jgi:N-acetylneuraminate synthase
MTKVIAEIGVNHNGIVDIAKQLIVAAKGADAWAVKFQKRDVDLCYADEELKRPCGSPWGTTVEDKVRGRELSWNEMDEIVDYCEKIDIAFACSCFDLRSLAELNSRYGPRIAFNKIPSAMAMHDEFVRAVAGYRRLTFISTGLLNSFEQIRSQCTILEKEKCPYIINHCVALYPTPLDRLDLNIIKRLSGMFPPPSFCEGIGYSGHEVGVLPSVIAALLGAQYVERHVTINRTMYGADHAASLEPQGLWRLVRDIGTLDLIGGSFEKRLRGDEKNPVKRFDVKAQ